MGGTSGIAERYEPRGRAGRGVRPSGRRVWAGFADVRVQGAPRLAAVTLFKPAGAQPVLPFSGTSDRRLAFVGPFRADAQPTPSVDRALFDPELIG